MGLACVCSVLGRSLAGSSLDKFLAPSYDGRNDCVGSRRVATSGSFFRFLRKELEVDFCNIGAIDKRTQYWSLDAPIEMSASKLVYVYAAA